MYYHKINILVLLALGFYTYTQAQQEKRMIRQGTKEYSEQKYGNAEVSYQKASVLNPESFEANFNLGDAMYKQGKYDQAIDKFVHLSQTTSDKSQRASLHHNIGNSYLNKTATLLKEQKLDGALKNVENSINSYKESLKNNPSDRETRYNLSYAHQLKKKLEEMKKQQQNNNKNQQDQSGEGDNKDQQDQNKQEKDKPNDKKQDKESDQGDKDSNNEDADQKGQKPMKGQISKEDAERLLNAIENDEKRVHEKLNKAKGVKTTKHEKDW
jgi:Ca-activated chloride channel homolog